MVLCAKCDRNKGCYETPTGEHVVICSLDDSEYDYYDDWPCDFYVNMDRDDSEN